MGEVPLFARWDSGVRFSIVHFPRLFFVLEDKTFRSKPSKSSPFSAAKDANRASLTRPEVSLRFGQPGLETAYRGTSPVRQRNPLGPYRRPMPRVLGGSWGGGGVIMGR